MCISGRLGDTNPFVKRQGDGAPIDQLRIDNWPGKEDTKTRYASISTGTYKG